MTYLVSVTSQGQISIPARFRRELGLEKTKKVVVSKEGNKLSIEAADDLLSLGGIFKTNKKIPFKKIRQGFEEYLAKEATGV
ncbi:MAG: Uncharacterized protein G01um10147_187 [Microgenomates group bacterium Gr01-1014_7]|nr:MAG: Uncharacterized protein G01um10147_187 [Microgenomates group bacterium Gr01-1014_7]